MPLFMAELINVFPSEQPNSSYLRGILPILPNKVRNSMRFIEMFQFFNCTFICFR